MKWKAETERLKGGNAEDLLPFPLFLKLEGLANFSSLFQSPKQKLQYIPIIHSIKM